LFEYHANTVQKKDSFSPGGRIAEACVEARLDNNLLLCGAFLGAMQKLLLHGFSFCSSGEVRKGPYGRKIFSFFLYPRGRGKPQKSLFF